MSPPERAGLLTHLARSSLPLAHLLFLFDQTPRKWMVIEKKRKRNLHTQQRMKLVHCVYMFFSLFSRGSKGRVRQQKRRRVMS